MGESGPEKAGVGGSIPSLATTPVRFSVSSRIGFHQRPEHGVHAGLVALALRFKPVEHVFVQADIDAFFRSGHQKEQETVD